MPALPTSLPPGPHPMPMSSVSSCFLICMRRVMTPLLHTSAVKIRRAGIRTVLSSRPGTVTGDYCQLRHHLHLSHTAGQEQARIQVSFAHHPLIVHPPTAWAPFSKGRYWGLSGWLSREMAELKGGRSQSRSFWTRGLEGPPLGGGGSCSEHTLTGAMQPAPKETQRGRDRGAR